MEIEIIRDPHVLNLTDKDDQITVNSALGIAKVQVESERCIPGSHVIRSYLSVGVLTTTFTRGDICKIEEQFIPLAPEKNI